MLLAEISANVGTGKLKLDFAFASGLSQKGLLLKSAVSNILVSKVPGRNSNLLSDIKKFRSAIINVMDSGTRLIWLWLMFSE